MVHADALRHLRRNVLVEILAAELRVQIVRQIVPHEIFATHGERVAMVEFPERVVQSGVHRAGRHQRAQLRDGHGEVQFTRDLRGCLQIFGLQREINIQRMRETGKRPGNSLDSQREGFHGAESRLVRNTRRGEGPDVAERDRRVATRGLAASQTQPAAHIQNGDPVDFPAPEFVGSPIQEIFEGRGNLFNAGVGCLRGEKQRGHGEELPAREAT